MGFIDKILDTMNLNPDDEDDFDNDDYYFDDEPEETHKSRFSRKEADEESQCTGRGSVCGYQAGL